MNSAPTHDRFGINVFDPNDTLGFKSDYITRLQQLCLRTHLPRGDGSIAVDLGCGYGRLTPLLAELGWQATGIDPSGELLEYARQHYGGPTYIEGGLPALPFADGEVSLILLQNVLRPLRFMDSLHLVQGMGRYVKTGGWVAIVENIRPGHPQYVPESDILSLMQAEGLELERRVPFRAARWWVLYLIRYGLVSPRYFDRIAAYELSRMSVRTKLPSWQYCNVLYLFRKR